jgi:hypothetical protein
MKSWHTSSLVLWLIGILVIACSPSTQSASTPTRAKLLPTRTSKAKATVTIAKMLSNPPPIGTVVELDAYYVRKWNPVPDRHPPFTETPEPQIHCPFRFTALTDTPMYGYLHDLDATFSNAPLATEEYLVAVDPAQTQRASIPASPELPFHARLRGRFGDPALAHCAEGKRVFVVERVLRVYEQEVPENVFVLDLPNDFSTWTRYEDSHYSFSIPHPPDWNVTNINEPNIVFGVAFASPEQPAQPVMVRVYDRENVVDPNDLDASPIADILETSSSYGMYQQGSFDGKVETQGLAGSVVSRQNEQERVVAAVFGQNGKSYEIRLRYPLGIQAQQKLLTTYIAMVQGFRFGQPQSVTATPPINQELGSGPFLSQEEAWQAAKSHLSTDASLREARLMPEAAARTLKHFCPFQRDGHPEGVWVLWSHGTFENTQRSLLSYLDATDGAWLCGLEIPKDESPFE